jgi:hypothetical protein
MVYSYGLGPLIRMSLVWYTVMDEDLARPAAFEGWARLCAQVRIISGTKVLEFVVLKYLFFRELRRQSRLTVGLDAIRIRCLCVCTCVLVYVGTSSLRPHTLEA